MSYKHLFIEEQQVMPFSVSSEYSDYADNKINDWKNSFGMDDVNSFEDCIQTISNIGIKELKGILTNKHNDNTNSNFKRDYLKLLERKESLYNPASKSFHSLGSSVPFFSFFYPFASNAENKLRLKINKLTSKYQMNEGWITEKTISDCIRQLIEHLYMLANKVLILELNISRISGELEGDDSESRFSYYTNNVLTNQAYSEYLYEEYPVLIRLIMTRSDYWVDYLCTLIERLFKDRVQLENKFVPKHTIKSVDAVEMGMGDSHRKGASVAKITVNNNVTFIYKPRNLDIDDQYQQLIQWFNKLEGSQHLFVPSIINKKEYGWVEFIDYKACNSLEQVKRFYSRIGTQLALLYLMNAVDFHAENIIAHGEYPVLIDLESLFHQEYKYSNKENTAYINTMNVLNKSVTATGVLPFLMYRNKEGEGLDISALGSTEGQTIPKKLPAIENIKRDDMRIEAKYIKSSSSENKPQFQNRSINVIDYIEDIVEGFERTYYILMRNKHEFISQLALFSQVEVRYIARSTPRYGDLLRISFHPDYMRNGIERDILFHRLWLETKINPYLKRLAYYEKRDLLNGDIPYFTTRPGEKHLYGSEKDIINDFFPNDSLSVSIEKVKNMSEKDCKEQIQVIRMSMLGITSELPNTKYNHYVPSEDIGNNLDKRKILEEAINIGEYLKDRAVHGINKEKTDVCWVGVNLVGTNETKWSLSPVGADLYDGLSGIALFFAYLSEATGREDFKLLAEQSTIPIVRYLESLSSVKTISDIGAFSGVTSSLYLLHHLSSIWKDETLKELIIESTLIIKSFIKEDRNLDVIGGAAGAAIIFLNIYEDTKHPIALEAAESCAEHLIDKASPQGSGKGVGWIGAAKSPLSGFSHGVSGIIWPLAKLYQVTKKKKYLQFVQKGLTYERELFINEQWLDLRFENQESAAAWCHGAPGILLNRLLLSESDIYDSVVKSEIEKGINSTIQYGFGRNHSLCHGDLGNAQIIRYAAELLGNDQWKATSDNAFNYVLSDIKKRGWKCGISGDCETPGLMTGLSGIGLALLKTFRPTTPSVLWLEPPKK
ncbi:type 2 lanthipeptide synthetase LanM family protein [Virgibacillus sp. YIM 98842]|uniref:type 2 lanthipeptide synthetase LanM family protein n=1 Tax=Virgibacillus sp. YIM 98842 TaxID=2663533 RepID=UPI0013D9F31F|nr:type 2 lanthipeptide synthetase LanM family protein [Virgibacillus sp. YIM 98842]